MIPRKELTMKYLIPLFLLLGGQALASPCNKPVVKKPVAQKTTCSQAKPAPKKVTPKRVTPKKVEPQKITVLPAPTPAAPKTEPCCDQKGVKVYNNNVNRFSINVQPSVGNVKPEKVRVVERVRIRTRVVPVHITNPNRLLLLAGAANTGFSATKDSCCNVNIKPYHQFDAGLMYVRDINSFSLGGAITFRQNVYLGLGFNF